MDRIEHRLKAEIKAQLRFDSQDMINEDDRSIGWNQGWYAGRILLLRELLNEEQFKALKAEVMKEME